MKQGKTKAKTKNLKCFFYHKEGNFKKICPEKKFEKKEWNAGATTVEEKDHEFAGLCIPTESRGRGASIQGG